MITTKIECKKCNDDLLIYKKHKTDSFLNPPTSVKICTCKKAKEKYGKNAGKNI